MIDGTTLISAGPPSLDVALQLVNLILELGWRVLDGGVTENEVADIVRNLWNLDVLSLLCNLVVHPDKAEISKKHTRMAESERKQGDCPFRLLVKNLPRVRRGEV